MPSTGKFSWRVAAIFLMVCLTGPLMAQEVLNASLTTTPYVWRNAKIVAGGFITGIAFSPAEKELAYVRTDIGGAYRFDKAKNTWVPLLDWVGPRNSNLMGVESVTPHPTDPEKVYLALGTYYGGPAAIARSGDRGKTFQLANLPISMGGNEDGRGMGERLAIDPGLPDVLYFGSRRHGLWKSTDGAAIWAQVTTFPVTFAAANNRGAAQGQAGLSGGISFVLFAPQREPGPSRMIYAGVAEASAPHRLYRSKDAGATWEPLSLPAAHAAMMPHRGAVAPDGTLYFTLSNHIGPNGATGGAVYKFTNETFTEITPPRPARGNHAGFAAVSLDAQRPGTLMVSTLDRWNPGDDIYRSTDGGATWKEVSPGAVRDPAVSPYLMWGQPQPRFGWWLAAMAIDPFDSNHAVYGTGATIWGTHNLAALDRGEPTRWAVEAEGIEETAVLALLSPPAGVPLISGVGDIGGFTHEDLTQSPKAGMHENPRFTNTNFIDVAWMKPSLVVRTGTAGGAGASRDAGSTAGISEDGEKTWRPLSLPQNAAAATGAGGGFFGSSALLTFASDGSALLASTPGGAMISRDLGSTWNPVTGLPANLRPVADRAAAKTFHAIDLAAQKIFASTDGGATFSAADVTGLPTTPGGRGRGGGGAGHVQTSFLAPGQLFVQVGSGVFHSTDAGRSFARMTGDNLSVNAFALGAPAATNANIPTLFVTGTLENQPGFFRSTDLGKTFTRINDDAHQFGAFPTVIAADPRKFGRLYIGTNGRGIIYGEPGDQGLVE